MGGRVTVPSSKFVALVWPALFRGSMAIAFLWSAVQLIYLSFALSKGAPTPTALLVFERHGAEFTYSLIFHSATFIVFGLALLFAGKVGRTLEYMALGRGKISVQICIGLIYSMLITALLVVAFVSNDKPRYQVFIDSASQEIVRRDTQLMPPGVTQVSVPFSEIRTIESKVSYSGWWGDRLFLRLVTLDWQRIDIAQGKRGEPPEVLFELAQDIAERSGAELDLSSKLRQLR